MMGLHNQFGDVRGQTHSMVLRPYVPHRAAWQDCLLGAPFRATKSADGIVEGAETVTGSYRTPSGTPGGAVHGPRTVPTASGSARANPRCGKGFTVYCKPDPVARSQFLHF